VEVSLVSTRAHTSHHVDSMGLAHSSIWIFQYVLARRLGRQCGVAYLNDGDRRDGHALVDWIGRMDHRVHVGPSTTLQGAGHCSIGSSDDHGIHGGSVI
jgi:hypothetical protein